MPFAYQLETLGGLNIDSEILLLPVKKTVALTTLEQSGDLAEKLKDLGVGQVNLSLNGTLQGGLNHYYQKSLKLDGRIGSREEYQKLASDLKEAGGTLTMGLDMARVYRQKSFDGFSLNSQVSRTINNYVTQLFQINAATNDFDLGKAAYMVKPDLAAENTRRIVQALNQWTPEEKPVIRLGGFGEFLASDNRKEALGRQETQAIYESLLEELAQDNALAFEHGNAYVYPYASFLYNLDNANSGHKDFDAVIPFVQMALHGLVGYSGSPINLAVNERGGSAVLPRGGEYALLCPGRGQPNRDQGQRVFQLYKRRCGLSSGTFRPDFPGDRVGHRGFGRLPDGVPPDPGLRREGDGV